MAGTWAGTVLVKAATDKALLVEYESEEFWIPKSQIHDDSEIYSSHQLGEEGELVLPYWFAEQKGLEG